MSVTTQDVPQCLVKQVGCGVVLFDLQVTQTINNQLVTSTLLQWGRQFNPVQVLLVWRMLNVNNPANLLAVVIDDVTSIGNLATHFGIEWGDVKDDFDVLVIGVGRISLLTIMS